MTGWWPGDGNADDIQNGNDGTPYGATFTTGKVGQAFSLDGVDDHVRIPDNANLNLSGAFSVDFWMKGDPTQSGPFYDVVDKSHGFTDGSGWAFEGVSSAGTLAWGIGGVGGTPAGERFLSAGTLANVLDNQFHHIAGVYTGSALEFYLDGVLQSANPFPYQPFNNNRDVFIGRAFGGGTPQRHFRGLVDEVSVYNRALSDAEILSIFEAGSTGKCPCPGIVPLAAQSNSNLVVGSCDDLYSYIEGIGVTCSTGEKLPGVVGCTAVEFSGGSAGSNLESKPKGNTVCVTTDISFHFDVATQITKLTWQPCPAACSTPDCQGELTAWQARIDAHEQHHVQDAQNIVASTNKKWQKPKKYKACATTEIEAVQQINSNVEKDTKTEVIRMREENKTRYKKFDDKNTIDNPKCEPCAPCEP